MFIKISEDRKIITVSGVAGTQNENNATELMLDIPEKFQEYGKEIFFFQEDETPIGTSIIEENSFKLTNSITKYEKVLFCIKFVKDNDEWITELKTLKFNKNLTTDEEIPEEEVKIIDQIISVLEEEILKVKDLQGNITFLIEDIERKIVEGEFNGKDAVINGVNTLEIIAGDNVELEQVDSVLKINVEEYDDSEIKQEFSNLDTEVDRLSENVNNIATDVDKIDKKVATINSQVETNTTEIKELEENQNYLEENKADKFEVDGNTIEFNQNNILQIPNKNDLMFQSVTYGNHESGYRKWRNGYIEQWGVATSNANGDTEFTMHQPHIDTNFSIFIEPREMGNFYHYAIPSHVQKFRARIQSRDSTSMAVKFQWRSYGYWK